MKIMLHGYTFIPVFRWWWLRKPFAHYVFHAGTAGWLRHVRIGPVCFYFKVKR